MRKRELDPSAYSPQQTENLESGAAESGAVDADLAHIIDAWPALPAGV